MKKTSDLCHSSYQPTHLPAHDICIVQGFANGHIMIIGHLISRMTSVSPKKCSLKIWIRHPLNRMISFHGVKSDKFRNIHRGIVSIHTREIGQEKVNGRTW